MNCQVCHKLETKYACSKCHVTYYCSIDCQRSDWKSHKTICSSICNTTTTNPWFSKVQRSDPYVTIKTISPEGVELFKNKDNFMALIQKDEIKQHINTYRGMHGGTFLHMAVKWGMLDIVQRLIENGAYVNVTDWMVNTPLYYACSCADIKDRMLIVEYLVSKGAYIIFTGGYSGLRPSEAARKNGFNDVADYLEVEENISPFNQIRHLINKPEREIPKKLKILVRQFIDLEWRRSTITHFIQKNRAQMFQNAMPRPDMKLENMDDIEAAYRECCWRHVLFTNGLNELKNSNE
jgi:hypothetical protein